MSEKSRARVTVAVGLRRQAVVKEASTREEIPRLARLLALAHRWDSMLTDGTVASQAEIARRAGLSPARVSQILELRYMPPIAQERILTSRRSSVSLPREVGDELWATLNSRDRSGT